MQIDVENSNHSKKLETLQIESISESKHEDLKQLVRYKNEYNKLVEGSHRDFESYGFTTAVHDFIDKINKYFPDIPDFTIDYKNKIANKVENAIDEYIRVLKNINQIKLLPNTEIVPVNTIKICESIKPLTSKYFDSVFDSYEINENKDTKTRVDSSFKKLVSTLMYNDVYISLQTVNPRQQKKNIDSVYVKTKDNFESSLTELINKVPLSVIFTNDAIKELIIDTNTNLNPDQQDKEWDNIINDIISLSLLLKDINPYFKSELLEIIHSFQSNIKEQYEKKVEQNIRIKKEQQNIIDKNRKFYLQQQNIIDQNIKFYTEQLKIHDKKYRVPELKESIKKLKTALNKTNAKIIDKMAEHVKKLKQRTNKELPNNEDIRYVLKPTRISKIEKRFKEKFKSDAQIYNKIVRYILLNIEPTKSYNIGPEIFKYFNQQLIQTIKRTNDQIINKMATHVEKKVKDTQLLDEDREHKNETAISFVLKERTFTPGSNIRSRFKSKFEEDNHIYSKIISYLFELDSKYAKERHLYEVTFSFNPLITSINELNKALKGTKEIGPDQIGVDIKTGGNTVANSYIDYTIDDSTRMRINNLVFFNTIKFIRYKYYIKNSDSLNIYSIIFKDYFTSLILSILLYILKMEKLSFGIIIDQVLSIGAFYKYKDHKYLLLPYYIAFL